MQLPARATCARTAHRLCPMSLAMRCTVQHGTTRRPHLRRPHHLRQRPPRHSDRHPYRRRPCRQRRTHSCCLEMVLPVKIRRSAPVSVLTLRVVCSRRRQQIENSPRGSRQRLRVFSRRRPPSTLVRTGALHSRRRSARAMFAQSAGRHSSSGTRSISGGMSTPCLLYASPSPRDSGKSRMPSSA